MTHYVRKSYVRMTHVHITYLHNNIPSFYSLSAFSYCAHFIMLSLYLVKFAESVGVAKITEQASGFGLNCVCSPKHVLVAQSLNRRAS